MMGRIFTGLLVAVFAVLVAAVIVSIPDVGWPRLHPRGIMAAFS